MSSRSERLVFEPAGPADSPEILEILEDIDFKGKISLTFTRRPDPYASLQKEGRQVDVIGCRDRRTGRLMGVAASAINSMFLNGEPADIGYVFGLRVRKEYRRKTLILPRGFQYLFSLHQGINLPFYLTTILEENTAAQRLLEKRRPRMPVYQYFGDYETYALATGKRAPGVGNFRFRAAGKSDVGALAAFLRTQGRRFQFFPVLGEADLDDPDATLSFRDFHLLLDPRGEIAAAGAVWDQRAYKQYVLSRYGGIYRLLYPFSFLFPVFGYPGLAKPGSVLNFFTLSFWAVRDDDPEIFDLFVRLIAGITRSFSYFVLGVDARHPLRNRLRRKPHLVYKARMYVVHKQEDEPLVRGLDRSRVPYLEIGRL